MELKRIAHKLTVCKVAEATAIQMPVNGAARCTMETSSIGSLASSTAFFISSRTYLDCAKH